jgi:hypothetical protein
MRSVPGSRGLGELVGRSWRWGAQGPVAQCGRRAQDAAIVERITSPFTLAPAHPLALGRRVPAWVGSAALRAIPHLTATRHHHRPPSPSRVGGSLPPDGPSAHRCPLRRPGTPEHQRRKTAGAPPGSIHAQTLRNPGGRNGHGGSRLRRRRRARPTRRVDWAELKDQPGSDGMRAAGPRPRTRLWARGYLRLSTGPRSPGGLTPPTSARASQASRTAEPQGGPAAHQEDCRCRAPTSCLRTMPHTRAFAPRDLPMPPASGSPCSPA